MDDPLPAQSFQHGQQLAGGSLQLARDPARRDLASAGRQTHERQQAL